MAKKKDLGQGIRALLSNIESKNKPTTSPKEEGITGTQLMDIKWIEANIDQPRKEFDQEALEELAASIKIHGIIQPLTVRKLSGKKYQLISGERRLKASKIAGLTTVPVYIRKANDQELLEMALIENIQRQDLNAIEIAIGYNRLLDECKLSHEDLSKRVSKKRSTVSNYLRLLKLPPEIQKAVISNTISMGHARSLAGIEDVAFQIVAFQTLMDKNLSVRALEKFVSSFRSEPQKRSNSIKTKLPIELQNLVREFKGKFGTSVSISRNQKGKGSISIPFSNDKELNYILDILQE